MDPIVQSWTGLHKKNSYRTLTRSLLNGMLVGLQSFKSQTMWNVVGISITYSLSIVLLALFNKSLFILIGWTTGYVFSIIAYLFSYSGWPGVQRDAWIRTERAKYT